MVGATAHCLCARPPESGLSSCSSALECPAVTAMWKRRFNELFPSFDTADTNDITAQDLRSDGVLSVVSALSNGTGAQPAEESADLSVNCVRGVSADEEDERDAFMNEQRYAVRQTIPQATMIAGLLEVSRTSLKHPKNS